MEKAHLHLLAPYDRLFNRTDTRISLFFVCLNSFCFSHFSVLDCRDGPKQ
uniref:Uncharacterized protein n=1 Tax=Anguilla anguilla TaxID=7936 RepID=A0A0E9XEM0_ANGAN